MLWFVNDTSIKVPAYLIWYDLPWNYGFVYMPLGLKFSRLHTGGIYKMGSTINAINKTVFRLSFHKSQAHLTFGIWHIF